jgi:BlaI family penicillinase repressor
MSKPRISDAEWTVMRALWERSPASARDVLEAAGPATGWAYSTVKTLLDRLVAKKAVRTKKRANVLFYEPRLSQEDARASAVRSLVERAFEGAFGSLVQHMLAGERLTPRERSELRALLDAHDGEQGASKEAP